MTIFSKQHYPIGYYIYAYLRDKDSIIAKAGLKRKLLREERQKLKLG